MARKGYLQPVSCFALSITLLVILALSSYQASATSSSSSESVATTISDPKTSLISWPWNWKFPKDWFKNIPYRDILHFLDKVRIRILDEMLKILGLPTTGQTISFVWKAVNWLGDKLYYVLSDPRARIDTVMNWIVDSIMNPYKTLTDGMMSFRRLFRYLHKIKKGSFLDFATNPVYKCYKEFFPGCVADSTDIVIDVIVHYFNCSWLFYERCQLRWWWENGQWKVPKINGGDPCKILPKKKCADDPPIGPPKPK